MNELVFWSATELARASRSKHVSVQEVIDGHLRRITAINPALNAVVQLTGDQACEQARVADQAIARRRDIGPLHGVPVTVKDTFDTAGIISTAGTSGRVRHVPAKDATVVKRLKHAGAIVLGKTNVSELAMDFESDNLIYGRTNNPYDRTRTSGGSSGGEAAIIAAGGSPLGIGSDLGGSVRLPAHFCGITGLKVTSGLIPGTGHFPGHIGPLAPLISYGPLARCVEDLQLALPILAGEDGRDPYVVPVRPDTLREVQIEGLRIAFYTENEAVPPAAETISAVKSAARAANWRPTSLKNKRSSPG